MNKYINVNIQMLIYKDISEDRIYCYIHIPKNSGKFIREKIKSDINYEVLNEYWGLEDYTIDMAHIPFMLRNEYIHNTEIDNYYTYTRNPYNRIISGFFYKNPECKKEDFKIFVKNELTKMGFDQSFEKNIIHYFPQYMFLCNQDLIIKDNIKTYKLENNDLNIDGLNIREYNLRDYYDTEILSIINEIYKKDFELFDYKIISDFC